MNGQTQREATNRIPVSNKPNTSTSHKLLHINTFTGSFLSLFLLSTNWNLVIEYVSCGLKRLNIFPVFHTTLHSHLLHSTYSTLAIVILFVTFLIYLSILICTCLERSDAVRGNGRAVVQTTELNIISLLNTSTKSVIEPFQTTVQVQVEWWCRITRSGYRAVSLGLGRTKSKIPLPLSLETKLKLTLTRTGTEPFLYIYRR